jgi:hypothetical protein
VRDYDFSVVEELYGPEPFSDGLVEFRSEHAIVSIRLDRGDVLIRIGPIAEPEIARVSIQTAAEALSQGKVKAIIAPREMPNNFEERIDFQLAKYASALRQYCEPILRADFSDWLSLNRFALEKMQKEYRALTGQSLPDNERLTTYVRSKS